MENKTNLYRIFAEDKEKHPMPPERAQAMLDFLRSIPPPKPP